MRIQFFLYCFDLFNMVLCLTSTVLFEEKCLSKLSLKLLSTENLCNLKDVTLPAIEMFRSEKVWLDTACCSANFCLEYMRPQNTWIKYEYNFWTIYLDCIKCWWYWKQFWRIQGWNEWYWLYLVSSVSMLGALSGSLHISREFGDMEVLGNFLLLQRLKMRWSI